MLHSRRVNKFDNFEQSFLTHGHTWKCPISEQKKQFYACKTNFLWELKKKYSIFNRFTWHCPFFKKMFQVGYKASTCPITSHGPSDLDQLWNVIGLYHSEITITKSVWTETQLDTCSKINALNEVFFFLVLININKNEPKSLIEKKINNMSC